MGRPLTPDRHRRRVEAEPLDLAAYAECLRQLPPDSVEAEAADNERQQEQWASPTLGR